MVGEVVLVVVDVVDEAEKEVGDVGGSSDDEVVLDAFDGCDVDGWFVVLLVVVEVIVATVVVVADVVDGACVRIEGELMLVEAVGQSNEVLLCSCAVVQLCCFDEDLMCYVC
jgi:hypothetical protein